MTQELVPQREVLMLSEDREPLARKLDEYHGRIDQFMPPELQRDTLYKIAVLAPLLRDGVVHRTVVREWLRECYGYLDEREFHNAWGVIADYIETGGKKLYGGTGLPVGEHDETIRE